MSVALPRVMSPQGVFLRTIRPIKATLELSITPLSTASLQLPEDETLPARGWVEMFTEMGSAGIFRVRSPQNSYGDDISISELEHAVVEVGDYLVKHNYSEMMAANAAVTALFGYYGGSRWQLGSTAALGTSQVAVQVNYDNVLQAILGILDQVPECMMTFDFSTSPWTMSFAARDTTVSAEGRLSRNVESAKITYDDSELCTKVYYETASTDAEGVPTSEWHYLQADAETISKYGIVEREVLTGDSFTAEEGQYVATRFLNRHKKPVLSIEISAEDLSQITGEAFDTFRIGKLLRLALPDYEVSEEQTITAMIWDDIYGNPRSVTVQLAEEEDSTVTFLHDMSSDSIGAMGGGGGGGSGKKKQDDAFKAYRTNFEKTDYYIDMNAQHIAEDGSILQQAGMYLDSNGVLIYAEDNERNLGAKLRVQADQIGMTIGSINYNAANLRTYATRAAFPATGQAGLFYKDNSTGQMYVWQNGTYERCSLSTDGKRVNTIHAGEIALAINESGEVEANIGAEKVNISATNSFYSLAGELERDANGNLVIKSAGGMRVRKTQSGVTSEFGVYDENNLTGGIVVQKINDGTTTSHIIGDRIVVGNDIEGQVLPDWIEINDGLIAQKATIVQLNAVKARVSTIEADYLVAADINATRINSAFSGSSVFSANYAYVRNFECASFTQGEYSMDLSDGIKAIDIDQSGNDYTLKVKHFYSSGWENVKTFSRATTLTGEWSGTVAAGKSYKVTASPQGNTVYSPALDDMYPSGSKTWAQDNKSFTQTIRVQDENGTDLYEEEMSFDTTDSYNAGHTDGRDSVKASYTKSNGVLSISKASSGGSSFPLSFSIDAGISYNSSTHKYTATAKCDDDQMDSVESGTQAYDAGVTAGNANRASQIGGYFTSSGTASGTLDYGTKYQFQSQYKDKDGNWHNGGSVIIATKSDRYDDGYDAAEAQFMLADITLEGAEANNYYQTIDTGGTVYYTAGTSVYVYDEGSKETYYDIGSNKSVYTRSATGGGGAYGGSNYTHYIKYQGNYKDVGTGWYTTSSVSVSKVEVYPTTNGRWITPTGASSLRLTGPLTRYGKGTRYNQNKYYTKS